MSLLSAPNDSFSSLSDAELELLVQDGGGYVALHILESINRQLPDSVHALLEEAVEDELGASELLGPCRNDALSSQSRLEMAITAEDTFTITGLLCSFWTLYDADIRSEAIDLLNIDQLNRILEKAEDITFEERRQLASVIKYVGENLDEDDDEPIDNGFTELKTCQCNNSWWSGFHIGVLYVLVLFALMAIAPALFAWFCPVNKAHALSVPRLCDTNAIQTRNT